MIRLIRDSIEIMDRYLHIVLIWFIVLFFKTGISQHEPLMEFKLKDQFDQEYSHEDFTGQICILIGSDRKGSQYNERWSIAIYDSLIMYGLQDSVKFLAIANLKGVPRLLRGFVKGKFPKKENQPILLDWKGSFADLYQFVPDKTNIILFDKSGKQVYRTAGQQLDFLILKELLAIFQNLF